jgi:hypothetical protein
MAITQGQTSVGTAATVINTSQQNPGFLHVTNLDNTDTVYVGGAGVTTANGHGIMKSDSIDLQCYAAQVFYAVSTKAGHNIAWIHVTP